MTHILAIDTTLGACSAALIKNEKILNSKYEIRSRGHVERLLPMVNELCVEASLDLMDLDYISVTIGPGTFAGVRIGLSAAKGMALALDIPIIPVTTLEVIAFSFAVKNKEFTSQGTVVIDARRGEVYLQNFAFNNGNIEALDDPLAVSFDQVSEKLAQNISIAIGSGCELFSKPGVEAVEGYNYPDASFVAKFAVNNLERAIHCDNVAPLYLRKPDAKLPKAAPVTISDD